MFSLTNPYETEVAKNILWITTKFSNIIKY